MLDQKVFKHYFSILCEMYDKSPSQFLTKIYFKCLKEIDNEEFKCSIENICKTYPYNSLPKPVHILDSIKGSSEERAWMALEVLEKTKRLYSRDRTITFQDKTINRCIRTLVGSWPKVGTMSEKEWNIERKNFINLYSIFSNQDNENEHPLVGTSPYDEEPIIIECPYLSRNKNLISSKEKENKSKENKENETVCH